MSEPIATDRCGFDRNESHSQECYVCTCGWSAKDDEMTEIRDATLVEELRLMAGKGSRHAYSIGHYWNKADEAADRIEQLETKDSARTKEHNLLVEENKRLERELAAALRSANRSPSDVEIRTNPDGTLDEVCAPGVHLEQMAHNHWFLSVGEVNVWLSAKGKIAVTYEDNRAGQSKEG